MDKFFQQFKDNLDNQPSPNFDTADWRDMNERLDIEMIAKVSSTSSFSGLKIWGIVSSILIIGLIAFSWLLYQKVQYANDKIVELEIKISNDLPLNKYQIGDPLETTHSNKILTNKISTPTLSTSNSVTNIQINKSKILSKKATTQTNKTSTLLTNENKSKTVTDVLNTYSKSRNILTEKETTVSISTTSDPLLEENLLLKKSKSSPKEILGKEVQLISLDKISSLNVQPLRIIEHSPVFNLTKKAFQQKKRNQQRLHFRPKGIELGLLIGQSNSINNSKFKFGNQGIVANVKFSKPIQLWISARQSKFNFTSTSTGEELGILDYDPQNDDYSFQGAEVNRKFWSADIGLQYTMRADKKVQPYLGAGLGTSTVIKNNVVYEFEEEKFVGSGTTGSGSSGSSGGSSGSSGNSQGTTIIGQFQYRTIYESPILEKGKDLSYTILKLGIGYQFTPHWKIQIEGNYIHQIENFENQLPNSWNSSLGIFYLFKK